MDEVEAPPHVVVMGVSGTGKTRVGAAVARRASVAFVDGDDLHPAANIAAMRRGRPLTDADRGPWLRAVGEWLAARGPVGGVVACSALRRSYRDELRRYAPRLQILFLHGDTALIAQRQANRPGHFMPSALLVSQLAVLEPPTADEHALAYNVALPVEAIVTGFLAAIGRPPSD